MEKQKMRKMIELSTKSEKDLWWKREKSESRLTKASADFDFQVKSRMECYFVLETTKIE